MYKRGSRSLEEFCEPHLSFSTLRVKMVSKLMLTLFFFHLISTVVLALNLNRLHGNISINPSDIKRTSLDFGNVRHVESLAVLYPNSAHDIVELVKMSYQSEKAFPVSPKGSEYSLYGQSQVADGVVIDMTGTKVSLQERKNPFRVRWVVKWVEICGKTRWPRGCITRLMIPPSTAISALIFSIPGTLLKRHSYRPRPPIPLPPKSKEFDSTTSKFHNFMHFSRLKSRILDLSTLDKIAVVTSSETPRLVPPSLATEESSGGSAASAEQSEKVPDDRKRKAREQIEDQEFLDKCMLNTLPSLPEKGINWSDCT
ncbi:hypothetical protein GIB67_003451 [Kingdonia uniflora]|uniref:Uncharacterized protein n=1 Tax=Kingdonia uniflora TaxID=39325 RepID=A0A7J7P9E8_9MAGN|nr:hypothetical protein GIB67_003451 [Kingdonia uniflora]